MMLEITKAVWRTGAIGQPPRLARQIMLANQIATLAILSTLPYQIFYLVEGLSYYLPVFVANLAFIGLYATTPLLNRARRFDAARNLVLGSVCAQLLTVTALISSGAGVHLFYLTFGECLGLIFAKRREVIILGLLAVTVALFLFCQFAFPPGTTLIEIPFVISRVMYGWSATGAVLLAGAFSILFRIEIDNAESALTRSNRELERMSSVDPLTGLANRRALDDFLTREISRCRREKRPLSVLLADVDSFKAYNDHYGHLAGDDCLRQVAREFAEVGRRAGDVAARFGGEEFAVVLSGADAEGALRIGGKLRFAVENLGIAHERSKAASVVTISVGVATSGPGGLETPTELLERADEALYHAKRGGRNRVEAWDIESHGSADEDRTGAVENLVSAFDSSVIPRQR